MHSLESIYKEAESKVQEEQDLEYDGPQASSCEEANIPFFLRKASPGASYQYSLTFLFNHYLYVKLDCTLGL
jgi:hypothetical protein